MASKPESDKTTLVELSRLDVTETTVQIVGTAPLIVHRWSEKARTMMLEAQQTKTKAKKQPKDPQQDFEDSRYRLPNGRDGVPAVAFKAAIINAVSLFDGLTKVTAKQLITVIGEGPDQLIPLDADEPTMREDTVRIGRGTADLRYRAQYWPWSVQLPVRYIPSQITPASVLSLIDAAGHGGIGEWRPSAPQSSTGMYGTFEVKEG